MSQDLITTQQHPGGIAPFGQPKTNLPGAVNAGAVSIEQERAIAEARGQMQLAKMFPRDVNAAYAELMDACKLPAMAAVAFYSVPRAGGKVTGPSIRLAEEIARCYGNFEYGHRELSRSSGKSEVEVYAWDKEKNNRRIRQITVEHVIDTREGPKKMRDGKEIDDKISNIASKQVRGLILSMMPKWMVESAVEECRRTLAGENSEPISVRVRKMTQAFAKFGVTPEHLEKYLGHGLDTTLADELVDLMGVFNAIKDGTPPSEFFNAAEATQEAAPAPTAEAIKSAAAKGKAAKASPQTDVQTESKTAQKESNPVKEAAPPAPVPQEPAQESPAATEASTDDPDVF